MYRRETKIEKEGEDIKLSKEIQLELNTKYLLNTILISPTY